MSALFLPGENAEPLIVDVRRHSLFPVIHLRAEAGDEFFTLVLYTCSFAWHCLTHKSNHVKHGDNNE